MTIDGSHACHPALVLTPFRYKDNLTVGRLSGSLGREGDCIIVRNYYVPILGGSGATARKLTFSPHVETDRPHLRWANLLPAGATRIAHVLPPSSAQPALRRIRGFGRTGVN